ncbi:MAG: phosphoribosylglycinamide formyltransferase [Sphingomonadaceae bacterium]
MTAEAPRRARLAILISGRGSNMVALAEAAADPGFPAEAVLVVSNRGDAAGLAKAEARGIETAVVPSRGRSRADFEAELDRLLRARAIDLVALAGFMRVLTPGFVAGWADRLLNIHPSLLPAYPGLDTHARALAAGDREAGATVHLVTADLDAGPILAQARVPIEAGDTPERLAARVLEAELRLYPEALADHARALGFQGLPQPASTASPVSGGRQP